MVLKRKNYITRLFLYLALLLVVVSVLMAVAISLYLRETIEDEVISFNSALQKLATESSAQAINSIVSLADEISYDSKLIDILYAFRRQGGSLPVDEVSDYLKDKTTGNVWVAYPQSNLLEIHVLIQDGQNYQAISPRGSITEVLGRDLIVHIRDSLDKTMILPTAENPGRRGVNQYSFQILSPINDYVSGDEYGLVVANISEKLLYDSYRDLQSANKEFVIVDTAGTALSAKDKNRIGKVFLDPALASLGSRTSGYVRDNQAGTILFYQQIGGTEWYLVQKADINILLSSLRNMLLFIGLTCVLCILAIMLILKHFHHKITTPVATMNAKMNEVASGDLTVRADVTTEDEFGQMANSFNTMVMEIDNLLEAVRGTEKKKRLAELDFLRAQINPHFIYNTLSSIRFYVEMNKAGQAGEMLFHFSKLLRATLSRSDQFVTLKDEISTIEDYVALQKLRYPEGFDMRYELDENTLDCEIPNFILQPLVENAIFHNEGLTKTNTITISAETIVETQERIDLLVITVRDEGVGMDEEHIKAVLKPALSLNKVGLQNVQERMKLNYGAQYGLTIQSQPQKGTSILIKLPVRRITRTIGTEGEQV